MYNHDTIRDNLKKKLKRYGFALALFPAVLPFAGYFLATHWGLPNLFAFTTLFVLYGLLPLADWLVGTDPENPADTETKPLSNDRYFRFLLWLNLPIAIATVVGGIYLSQHWQGLNMIGQLGLILSCGTISAGNMINAGHELIHKRSRTDQNVGGLLLCLACYPSFKIEHLRGHHVHVATPKDQSTSSYGQSLYDFLPSALMRNFRTAWQLERERLAKHDQSVWSTANELVRWYALVLILIITIAAVFGLAGVLFFLLQSLTGIALLESVNYLEHYGLRRKLLPNGRYERVTVQHSWNSNHLLSNLLTFQLQRHSDHHANPQRPYQVLRHIDESPQLPAGYSTMILLAMVPPLWMRIMNPRVRQYYQKESGLTPS
ncbi:MAG: alkane 1-monooxygenase [Gammaproteobacteria bacterium]|nr:alkane 1-monooxygenase [Gammaproteobacteria bacterium]